MNSSLQALMVTCAWGLVGACSTESGGRKTPMAGKPVTTASPPATSPLGAAPNGAQSEAERSAATEALAREKAALAAVTGDPANPKAPGAGKPDAPASSTGSPPATTGEPMETTPTGTTSDTGPADPAPAARACTAGKAVVGPRYAKADLNLRSEPNITAAIVDVVPFRSELTYYWTSGAYACVVWKAGGSKSGWVSTSYLQTAKP